MADFQRIGKYQIVGEIGEGAMGVVYKAHDPLLNRHVAVKMISASLKADPELRERFLREAQSAALLNHPNIITIFDFGEEQDRIYMAMELLQGSDLKEVIGSPVLDRLEDKLAVMEQMADGMAFAHKHGVIHRDLKPGNVHLQPNGQVKILDFGLARTSSSDMTATGLVMGTPNYMSPEQVMGERVDARSDVFAMGALFYELLTNHKPFEADSVHGVMFRVVHKEAAPVRQWAPSLPLIVVQVVERCLDKDKNQRFQDAAELREALGQVRHALQTGHAQDATLVSAHAGEDVEVIESLDGEGMPPPEGTETGETQAMEAVSAPAASMRGAASTTARPAAGTGSRPPSPMSSRPPSRASSSRAPQSRSVAPRRGGPVAPSRAPLWIGLGVLLLAVLAALAGGGYWVLHRPAPVASPGQDQLGALTDALVATQLQLAQRDLDDKSYAAASAEAQQALKLAPGNRGAQDILRRAQAARKQVEDAAARARKALEAGDTTTAAAALSEILALDPRHPAATELSARLNQYFRQQAEDARKAAGESQQGAEDDRAQGQSAYKEASASIKEADGLMAGEQFAQATRGYLEARDAFDKARRAATEQRAAANAARPSAAPPVTAAAVPTAPPASVAVAPTPVPPVTASPAASPAPAAVERTFVTGKTAVLGESSGKGGPQGFDTGGIDIRKGTQDLAGTLAFEVSPKSPRSGETYTVTVFLDNQARKSARIRTASASAVANGRALPVTTATTGKEVAVGTRAEVARVTGTWPADVASWSMQVTVTADRGEFRAPLTLR